MADRAVTLNQTGSRQHSNTGGLPGPFAWAAYGALGLILVLSVGALAAVLMRADLTDGLRPADWSAIRFTVFQALLSALCSTLLAIPLARALARRVFPGRQVLITLLGAPFILPVIVAVLGLLAIFGRNGLLNVGLTQIGIEPISIFGLQGVVLAHVFFNMPLATRFFLQGWAGIPAERFRLAAALNFDRRATFRNLEWPMLRAVVPRAFLLIFLICLTSFAVALTLGGGPKATTIELAIYQAFTFDFDLGRAARLALIQLAIGLTGGAIAFALTFPSAFGVGLDRKVERWDADRPGSFALDVVVVSFSALFLILPLMMIAVRGGANLFDLPWTVFMAAFRSIFVAIASVAIMVILALPLSLWAATGKEKVVEGAGLLLISLSPLVMGTGLFLIVFPFVDPAQIALPATALVNAAAALPFALRALVPAVAKAEADFDRLSQSLSMSPGSRLRLVVLPRVRPELAFAAALTGALSMGDLGVITLFSGSDTPTLPLMIYRLMGSYQMDAAAGAALLLLSLSLAMFWLLDRKGRAHA